MQLLPLNVLQSGAWNIHQSCLVTVESQTGSGNVVCRGKIAEKISLDQFGVKLIDENVEIVRDAENIYENIADSDLEKNLRKLKLGFARYNRLSIFQKNGCKKQFDKFRNSISKNKYRIQARIDFTNVENPKLIELVAFTINKHGGKDVLKSFFILHDNSDKRYQAPSTFSLQLKRDDEDLKSYLTVFKELCVVIDMIPGRSISGWLSFVIPNNEHFNATCQHIDENGIMYLTTDEHLKIHELLKKAMRCYFSKNFVADDSDKRELKHGDPVIVFDSTQQGSLIV